MDYVNIQGYVCNTEEESQGEKPVFLVSPFPENLTPRMNFVSKFPIVFQIFNKILDYACDLSVDRISLTEKNKGGDYQSSAFSISTKLETSYENEEAQHLSDTLLKSTFTIKHAPFHLAMQMFTFVQEAIIIDKEDPNNQTVLDCLKKDYWLMDVLEDPIKKTSYFITYKPFKLVGLGSSFNLDVIDQARYQAFLTKYMEIECNQNILSIGDIIQRELFYLEQQYFIWLLNTLKKNFKMELVEYEG